jgi:hypothetical protein
MGDESTIPPYIELLWPTLRAVLENGHSSTIEQIVEKGIELEHFTPAQRAAKHGDGSVSEIEYRLGWACAFLRGLGALESSEGGLWYTTELGRRLTESDVDERRTCYLEDSGNALTCLGTKPSHWRGIIFMCAGAALTYLLTFLLLNGREWERLTPTQRLDIGCFEFLASWWIVYFTLSHLNSRREPGRFSVFTLRSFLDGISSHRGAILRKATQADLDEQFIREKARSSRDVQGIMIAVVVLLLTLVVVDRTINNGHLSDYQHVMRGPIFAVALTIIVAWMLSLDIFDTILNSFEVEVSEALRLRRYFYRFIGPFGRSKRVRFSGGVSYGYLGHGLMPIFVLMIFSWFESWLVGFGTAMYVLLAYPYYFGYWAVKVDREYAKTAVAEATELRKDEEWRDLGGEWAEVLERWIVNRDGDPASRSISGHVVLRVPSKHEPQIGAAVNEEPIPCVWPPLVLGLVFVILSIIVSVV